MLKKRKKEERAVFYTVLFVFCILFAVQVFYGLFPGYVKEERGERLGATLEDNMNEFASVDQSQNEAFVLLTFVAQTEMAKKSKILLNDDVWGDLSAGFLSIQGREGDDISVVGEKGSTLKLLEMPENLVDSFPESIIIEEGETYWGIVSLK